MSTRQTLAVNRAATRYTWQQIDPILQRILTEAVAKQGLKKSFIDLQQEQDQLPDDVFADQHSHNPDFEHWLTADKLIGPCRHWFLGDSAGAGVESKGNELVEAALRRLAATNKYGAIYPNPLIFQVWLGVMLSSRGDLRPLVDLIHAVIDYMEITHGQWSPATTEEEEDQPLNAHEARVNMDCALLMAQERRARGLPVPDDYVALVTKQLNRMDQEMHREQNGGQQQAQPPKSRNNTRDAHTDKKQTENNPTGLPEVVDLAGDDDHHIDHFDHHFIFANSSVPTESTSVATATTTPTTTQHQPKGQLNYRCLSWDRNRGKRTRHS